MILKNVVKLSRHHLYHYRKKILQVNKDDHQQEMKYHHQDVMKYY